MTLRRSGIALLGLLVAAPVVWAALRHHVRSEEALDLLGAAATAHQRVGYKGVAAWRSGKWSRSVEVVHDAESGRTYYRWASWMKSGYVTSGPSSRSPDPAAFCRDVGALVANYRAVELARTRFLGRGARVVRLEPRHEGRPSAKLTLDAETALPLQVATFRPDGTLYRVAAFRSLEIGPQSVAERTSGGWADWLGESVPPERLGDEVDFEPPLPDYLPEGFRCIECRVPGALVRHARLTFSDGLTAFDLVLSPVATPAQIHDDREARFGARKAARMTLWDRNRHLRRLARSDGRSGLRTRVHRADLGPHCSYELRLGWVDVRLTRRSDLAEEEAQRVLRSLRAR